MSKIWEFEKVYSDDGSELSTAALTTTLGAPLNLCYDGRFMWVTAATGVAIYEFWGESSDNEPGPNDLEDLIYDRYTEFGPKRKLKLITFISISGSQIKRNTRYLSLSLVPGWTGGAGSTTVGAVAVTLTQSRSDLLVASEVGTNSFGTALSPYFITKLDNKMVVSNGSNFNSVFVFDIATQRLENVLTFNAEPNGDATIANSNLHAQNSKLWVVNTRFNDSTPQRLITKTLAGTETSTNINVRPASTRTWIANGFNGYVYITNHNGVSICKYDQDTAALVTRIRTSAFPHHIWTTEDRRIFVGSENLLTTVDWDDDGVHFDHNTDDGIASDLVRDPVDGGKVYFARGVDIVQYTLSDGNMMIIGPDVDDPLADPPVTTDDWVITGHGITAPDTIATVPTQPFGSYNTRPYLFALSGTKVYLIALDGALTRKYYDELNGQGAIVGGTLQYFGELG